MARSVAALGVSLAALGGAVLANAGPAGATAPGGVAPSELTLPSGAGAPAIFNQPYLNMSCPTTSFCVATDWERSATQYELPVIWTFSGSSWTSQLMPLPSGANPVTAIPEGLTCTGAGSCLVVGAYGDTSGNSWSFIDTVTSVGGSWSSVQAPTSGLSDPLLKAVGCSSATSCVAAGYDGSYGSYAPFVETLASGSWSATALAVPSGLSDATLSAVSCASATSCVAVGNDQDSSNRKYGLLETLSGTTWSDQSPAVVGGVGSPSANTTVSLLNAVTCPASGSCLAVGAYQASSYAQEPLIDTLSGGSWSGDNKGTVGGSASAALDAVACYGTSISTCAADGYWDDSDSGVNPLTAAYSSGSSWTLAEAGEPSNAGTDAGDNRSSILNSVSCPLSTSCVAIGYYETSASLSEGLVDTLIGSSTTNAIADPSNASSSGGTLTAGACPSTTSCFAAGPYADSEGNEDLMLDAGAGSSWTSTEAVLPSSPPGDPLARTNAVACTSATSCVAVGSYEDTYGRAQALIATLSGGSWQTITAPEPSGAGTDAGDTQGASLSAVTCPAAGSCVAVGSYDNSGGHSVGLVEVLSVGTWTPYAAPEPSNANATSSETLAAVSCSAAGTCIAVGRYLNSSAKYDGVIESLSGSTVSDVEAPEPSNAGAGSGLVYPNLSAVACPGSGSCEAVGYYPDTSNHEWGWILTGSGTSWSATEAPEPANAASTNSATLSSVSCPSAAFCTAVGHYSDSSAGTDGLIDTLSSSTWTASEAPAPATEGTGSSAYATFSAVSCPDLRDCTAVGWFHDSSAYYWSLVETWSGSSWSAQPGADPPGAGTGSAQYDILQELACASSAWCVAGGVYKDSTGVEWGYIETGSGSSWSLEDLPLPSNAYGYEASVDSNVFGVGCSSDGGCEVAADYVDSGPTTEALLDDVEPPAPTVSGVSPSSGPGEGGATVTVSGTNFFPGATLDFGTSGASFAYASPTALSAQTPPGQGSVNVTVDTADGSSQTSTADEYSYGPGIASTLGLSAPAELYWDFYSSGYDQWASGSATPLSGCTLSGSGSSAATSCTGGTSPVFEVLDDTGSGAGWALSGYLAGGTNLPPSTALYFNGAGSPTAGVSSASPLAAFPFAATTPTSTCDFSGTCVAPIPAASCSHPSIGITSCASDPVSLAAASSANNQVDLYSAGSGSGEGDLCLASGSATSVGCVATTSAAFFDLGLPASARAEGYASASLVLTVSSGP